MTTTALISLMSADEARDCAKDIKDHEGNLRALVYDFYTREGWRALGYPSFEACAEREFDRSFQHLYRLVSATTLEQKLSELSPIGELVKLPETHARALKALPTPETQYEALQTAKQLAQAEGSDKVVQSHINKAVQVTAAKLRVSTIPLLSHLVNSGQMSVEDADHIGSELARFKPQTRGYIFQLIAKADGISSAGVVRFIGQQYERPDDKVAQLVIATLNVTGCLGGVPLRSANMTNAHHELDEARKEIESDELPKVDDYGPVNLTVWERGERHSAEAIATIVNKAWALNVHRWLGEILEVKA